MTVTEVKSGNKFEIDISPLEPIDFKSITKKKFFFDWKLEKEHHMKVKFY